MAEMKGFEGQSGRSESGQEKIGRCVRQWFSKGGPQTHSSTHLETDWECRFPGLAAVPGVTNSDGGASQAVVIGSPGDARVCLCLRLAGVVCFRLGLRSIRGVQLPPGKVPGLCCGDSRSDLRESHQDVEGMVLVCRMGIQEAHIAVFSLLRRQLSSGFWVECETVDADPAF